MLLQKTSISLMSTNSTVFGTLFVREILRVDGPVSKIIYVPQVRPPRLPWRKCRDIFVGQHIDRMHKWRPKKSSFVFVLISLTCLVSTDEVQKKSSFRTRLVGLINTKTKEY